MDNSEAVIKLKKYKFIEKIKDFPFVEKVMLFGSRARGTAGEKSDIDLAVVAPAASIKEWNEVEKVVEDADTLLSVDCVRFDALSDGDELKEKILRDGIEL